MLKHLQQLGFVGVQSLEQPVERDETGLPREDAIEPRHQGSLAPGRWSEPIGLEVPIEPPNQSADVTLGFAVLIGEGIKLVNKPLRMHPAKSVFAHVKLARIITDDNGFCQQAMGLDAPPDRSFGGDLDRVRIDLELGDAELVEMRGKGLL